MLTIKTQLAVDLVKDGWFNAYANIYSDNTIEVFGQDEDSNWKQIIIRNDETREIYPWILGESLIKVDEIPNILALVCDDILKT